VKPSYNGGLGEGQSPQQGPGAETPVRGLRHWGQTKAEKPLAFESQFGGEKLAYSLSFSSSVNHILFEIRQLKTERVL